MDETDDEHRSAKVPRTAHTEFEEEPAEEHEYRGRSRQHEVRAQLVPREMKRKKAG